MEDLTIQCNNMDLVTSITFFVNDVKQNVVVANFSSSTTLNTFLRDTLLLTGTKKMCEEGGCGVCIVVVKWIHPVDQNIKLLAVNSCLISLFSCHDWHIYTIESLGDPTNRNIIQDALIKFNASQCGYCTPGMVMNMYALQESNERLLMKDVEDSFGGNICRCTGYRPIISAFKSLCQDASSDLKVCLSDIEDTRLCLSNKTQNLSTDLQQIKRKLPFYFLLPGETWIIVYKFNDLLEVMKTFNGSQNHGCKLVAGNTAKGVYKNKIVVNVFVDISNIPDLRSHKINENFLILGANVTLTEAIRMFKRLSKSNKRFGYLEKVANHIDLVANVPVRNIGTLGGNLMIKHEHKEFSSDIFLILEACNSKLIIVDSNSKEYYKTPLQFLDLDMTDKVIKEIMLPCFDDIYRYESYKIMPRGQNAHALQNAGFLFQFNNNIKSIKSAIIVFGCVNKNFVHAIRTEQFLEGKNLFDNKLLQETLKILDKELPCDPILSEQRHMFRKNLAVSLFYKFILSIAPENLISDYHLTGRNLLYRPISRGTQDYDTKECLYPLARGISKIEAKYQVTGKAEYIMDITDYPNQLFAAFVLAKSAPGSKIIKIDIEDALKLKGVISFLDKNSIPGKNTFTPIEASLFTPNPIEEELFCNGTVNYHSQPIGVIVAESHDLAKQASDLVKVTYEVVLVKPLIKIRDVVQNCNGTGKIVQDKIIPPSELKGNADVKHEISGTFDMSWQYHFHMETQCCSAVPKEDGLDLYPSSQWMDLVQSAVSKLLNIPANQINVSVKRLGGGFGAKIIRNSMVSCAAALAAYILKRPVKIWLSLETNISAIGKRYPISSSYKISVDDQGIIQSLENNFYYDHGSSNNEPVMFLLLDTYLETYKTSTWYTNAKIVHTSTPPSCYTRAPGSAEGLAMIESIMEHAAIEIGMDPLEFRIKNMNPENKKLLEHINDLLEWADIEKRKQDIKAFNKENKWKKKGMSVVPMIFPFPLFFGYGAMVSIYHVDGTVAIAHGGIEIGQGLNTKVVAACAYKLDIPVEKITVKPSNNLAAPNAHMTGASITSEAICWGVMKACDILLDRIKPIKEKMNNATWEEVIKKCYQEFINLSATSMFEGPKEKDLTAYEIYGVCASEIELDVLTGQYQVTRVDLLEDVGDSMNPGIDIGQVEGAFVMGLGYFTTEEIKVNSDGEILTNRTWNYKPPGVKDIPIDFRIKFPKNNPNSVGVLKSKATGEPPFCLAVSVPLAIRQAVAVVRNDFDPRSSQWYPIDGASTVENTFMNCLHDFKKYTL